MSAKYTGKAGVSWYAIVATAFTVASGYSAQSMAATDSLVECDQLSGQQLTAEIGPHALSFEVVDHIATEEAETTERAIEAPQEVSDTPTPVLYLTPRVASILRDVFGSEIEGAAAASQQNEDPAARQKETVAPIAEHAETADTGESDEITPPVPLIEHAEDLRRFKPEMYRTDI